MIVKIKKEKERKNVLQYDAHYDKVKSQFAFEGLQCCTESYSLRKGFPECWAMVSDAGF